MHSKTFRLSAILDESLLSLLQCILELNYCQNVHMTLLCYAKMTLSNNAEFHSEQPMISKILGLVISLLSFGAVLQSTII